MSKWAFQIYAIWVFYLIVFTFSPLWSKKQVLEEIKVILKSSFEKNGTIWGRTNNLSEELSAWLIMVIFWCEWSVNYQPTSQKLSPGETYLCNLLSRKYFQSVLLDKGRWRCHSQNGRHTGWRCPAWPGRPWEVDRTGIASWWSYDPWAYGHGSGQSTRCPKKMIRFARSWKLSFSVVWQ